jgi:hypothetical protein
MEAHQTVAPTRRTRRSPQQWVTILQHHATSSESDEHLALRLGCAVSTIENQRKRLTNADAESAGPRARFVEVKRAAGQQGALSIRMANGATVTFETLPPPEYLAAALGLAG